jgi:hypothetical protein
MLCLVFVFSRESFIIYSDSIPGNMQKDLDYLRAIDSLPSSFAAGHVYISFIEFVLGCI